MIYSTANIFSFYYLLPLGIIKFLHGLGFDFIAHIDIGLHGLVVAVASPFHDYLGRDAHADGIADKAASARMRADDFILWFDLIDAVAALINDDTSRLVESSQLA